MGEDVNGRIKCPLANWTGVAYKAPLTKSDFKKTTTINSLY